MKFGHRLNGDFIAVGSDGKSGRAPLVMCAEEGLAVAGFPATGKVE